VTVDEYIELIVRVLGPTRDPNARQRGCLRHPLNVPLLIVAGPGTGKTTVLVLRALRAVLVDRIPPEAIMITTFTRKAAREIRTRLIEWGIPLIEHLLTQADDPELIAFLREVDINRFITGTLDGICEEVLASSRQPGERPLVVVETFAANQMLARKGEVYAESRRVGSAFATYLGRYTLTGDPPINLGDMTRTLRTVIDRLIQDEVDIDEYESAAGVDCTAREAVVRIFNSYQRHLNETGQMDFPLLERTFLQRVNSGNVPDQLTGLRVLLVDEYQDTNPLQERIYFELARATAASLTVVGDDDQSLYRFRGATIELFRDFASRAGAALGGTRPALLYLTDNYRSTPTIVTFFNSFAQNDTDFVAARIHPPKPAISPNIPSNRVPILGMFRDDAEELAEDLANFLHQVFRGGGRPADGILAEAVRCSPTGGDFGDAVLLSSTVNEFTRPAFGNPGRARLPSHLRDKLKIRGVECFNPRGRALKDIGEVSLMLGLVLEALDPSSAAAPSGVLAGNMAITRMAKDTFFAWRGDARAFLSSRPPQVNGASVGDVLQKWRRFVSNGDGNASEWPVLDVLYSFMPWIPRFQDDPECQVYLEAISRCAAEAATFSGFRALLLRDSTYRTRSIEAVLRDVLAPIADDLVEVDEEIMSSVPRDRFNMMTIHQAKGLEFPLVIVDVSSDFKTNHRMQAFKRFPTQPSPVTLLEDDLADCTPIGDLRTARTAIQRSFEDIVRLYYVAYSRPQSILLLVGCIQGLRYNTTIRNVATFWRADGTWPWIRPYVGRPPSQADALPFVTI
jgi:DNA helicase II / ATP-dependent DNA helicase PcrA